MNTGVELLRMLEPAVRPGGLPGPQRTGQTPIETRSFESLLEEARSATTPVGDEETTGKKAVNDPLRALSRVDLIDNAALLRIIGGRTSAGSGSDTGAMNSKI